MRATCVVVQCNRVKWSGREAEGICSLKKSRENNDPLVHLIYPTLLAVCTAPRRPRSYAATPQRRHTVPDCPHTAQTQQMRKGGYAERSGYFQTRTEIRNALGQE